MIASPVQRSSVEDALLRLTKRCVICPTGMPSCPTCAKDETCSLKPATCDTCQAMVCVRVNTIPGQQQAESSSPPIGGIVGGVVGGVFAIVAITFLVWRFCLRGRRRRDTWVPAEKTYSVGTGQPFNRTRPHSIASTVQTQASNVIQIAYIPGVTVRSAPDTPEVPTVPSSYAGTSAESTPQLEQHFFMPKRESQWSDNTSMHSENRISLTPSLATLGNRASVATTMYRSDAIVPPIPAQYAYQTQANVVSVKSGTSTPTNGRTSPAPKGQQTQATGNSQIVARNVTARPVEIRKGNSPGVPTMANLAAQKKETYKARKVNTPSVSDEKEAVLSPTSTLFDESPTSPLAKPRAVFPGSDNGSISNVSAVLPASGPLSSSAATANSNTTTADISAMIMNAMKSATQDAAHTQQRPGGSKHDSGPFSDSNEIADNRSDNRSL